MKLRLLLLMLCSALIFSSCQKDGGTIAYNYTFVNPTSSTLNLVMYPSQKDYFHNTNVFQKYRMDPGASVVIPSSQLTAVATYYIDVFSDDYTVSNWKFPVEQIIQDDNSVHPTYQNNYLQPVTYLDYSRLVCINGNDTQTNWTAIGGTRYLQDSYGDPGTPWSQLNTMQQYIKMTMTKSHTLTLYFTAPYAPSYGSNVLNVVWQVRADSVKDKAATKGTLYIKSPYDRDFGIYGTVGYGVTKSESGVSVKDTLVLTINQSDPNFFQGTFYMVRDTTGAAY